METDFDLVTNRREISNLNKWTFYPEEVLPMWLADMDFRTPQPILSALQNALEHGILGYELPGQSLLETIASRLEDLYGWKIAPEMILPSPGVGAGMSAAIEAVTMPGDGILVQPPIFPPFLQLPGMMGRVVQQSGLNRSLRDGHWHYEPDLESFNKTMESSAGRTKLFLLCNPHNPTGRTFTREELAGMAEICLRHDVLICSDEIHQGILLDGQKHTPIASLAPEIEKMTISFIGPGKTFNISGLHCAFAIIPDEGLRGKISAAFARSVLEVNSLGLAAAKAAYSGACDGWLNGLRLYLRANRDYAVKFIETELPELRTTVPEGTYLLWIDCGGAVKTGRMQGSPCQFFLEKAKLALSDGAEFGPGGEGFVRLNFACPRSILKDGLERMKQALR